jgi:hypothetical protein
VPEELLQENCLPAISGVGKDVENKNAFGYVVDSRDQSVVIPLNSESGPSTDGVGAGKITPHFNPTVNSGQSNRSLVLQLQVAGPQIGTQVVLSGSRPFQLRGQSGAGLTEGTSGQVTHFYGSVHATVIVRVRN